MLVIDVMLGGMCIMLGLGIWLIYVRISNSRCEESQVTKHQINHYIFSALRSHIYICFHDNQKFRNKVFFLCCASDPVLSWSHVGHVCSGPCLPWVARQYSHYSSGPGGCNLQGVEDKERVIGVTSLVCADIQVGSLVINNTSETLAERLVQI